jgi:acyl-CoA synthetase (AMP-forming)/AMP-acid ligase II
MNAIDYTHAAIITITQYEAAVYANDLDAARRHLLNTMKYIVAIAKQTLGAPVQRPHDLGRPDRTCRFHRILHNLTGILPIQEWTPDPRNHLALTWYECIELCKFHGWMPPALTTQPAQLQTPADDWPPVGCPAGHEGRRFVVVGDR